MDAWKIKSVKLFKDIEHVHQVFIESGNFHGHASKRLLKDYPMSL